MDLAYLVGGPGRLDHLVFHLPPDPFDQGDQGCPAGQRDHFDHGGPGLGRLGPADDRYFYFGPDRFLVSHRDYRHLPAGNPPGAGAPGPGLPVF